MHTHNAIFFVIAGIMLVTFVALIILSRIQARKRTEALRAVAQQIGFSFEGNDWPDQTKAPHLKTPLFQKSGGGGPSNLIVGALAGLDASLFDYSYTVSNGKSTSTITQTVAAYSQTLWLPAFELRPEGFFDRIGEAFVHRDIDFDSHPEFSKRYFLRGPAEQTIRDLFSPTLISFLEGMPPDEKWHIEGADTTLVIYRANLTVSPDQFPALLDKTSSIAKTFFSSPAGLSKPVR
jgi:hypothetical protein